MKIIDELYTKYPFYGTRRMSTCLKRDYGQSVGRKKVASLMRRMGIAAIYPKPHLSLANSAHQKFPYLLRGVAITGCNHAWSTDITFIRMPKGFLYLTAVIDWFSRYVPAWRLSNTLDVDFCLEALEEALNIGQPVIFNTDQGSQFTSKRFVDFLQGRGIKISMDGKGRATDNAICERLWRTIKYEEVYLNDYQSVLEAEKRIGNFFDYYNKIRPHQSLNDKTPWEVYSKTS